jgi:hypothetical protein
MSSTAREATITVFEVAVLLNYPWEMAQSVLYAPMGSAAEASWRCFLASLGDAAMILVVFAVGWVIYRDAMWFRRRFAGRLAYTIGIGVLFGILVELWGLADGRWQYGESMPRVPILEIGVVPLLQIPILALLTFWATARWMNRRDAAPPDVPKPRQ